MSAKKGMGAGTSCAWCTDNCNECQIRHNRSAVMAEAFRIIAQCCHAERCEDDSAELADACCECPAAEACDKYITKREGSWSESIRVPMSEAALALADAFNASATTCIHVSCAYNADGVCRYALVTGNLPERTQDGTCLSNITPSKKEFLKEFFLHLKAEEGNGSIVESTDSSVSTDSEVVRDSILEVLGIMDLTDFIEVHNGLDAQGIFVAKLDFKLN